MTTTTEPFHRQASARRSAANHRATVWLLRGGALAAPMYAGAVLLQASIRDGYHLTRHPASMLADGPGGWAQILNFVVCGLLMIGAALGTAKALHGRRGGTWAPRLLAVQGIGLLGAAAFRLDPADGFLGTPVGPPAQFSGHAIVQNQVGSALFLAMIICCFVLARHFTGAWRWLGPVAGTVFAVLIVWTYTGGAFGGLTLFVGVVTAWAWLSASLAQLARRTGQDRN